MPQQIVVNSLGSTTRSQVKGTRDVSGIGQWCPDWATEWENYVTSEISNMRGQIHISALKEVHFIKRRAAAGPTARIWEKRKRVWRLAPCLWDELTWGKGHPSLRLVVHAWRTTGCVTCSGKSQHLIQLRVTWSKKARETHPWEKKNWENVRTIAYLHKKFYS